MKWHTVHYSQYSEREFSNSDGKIEDLCSECYKELKHWLAGTSDEVAHLKNRVDELVKEKGFLVDNCEKLKQHNYILEKEKTKIMCDFESCKSLCPRNSSMWEGFIKAQNKDLMNRHNISTDDDTIC